MTTQELHLDSFQRNVLIACMLSVARVDGMSPEEDSLIRAFYGESETSTSFEDFDREMTSRAASMLPAARQKENGDQFAEHVIVMCLMTGYADGQLSVAEREHVEVLAAAANVDQSRVEELVQQVKDSLIGSLAHLPDTASVAALAKTL